MKKWNVKRLGSLVNVSKRTLHYYDNIGLLRPSTRLSNGYRVYTEEELGKLKKIISLKFCGFKLSEIRLLLECDTDEAFKLFSKQFNVLKTHVAHVQNAQLKLMSIIIKELKATKKLKWEAMIQFMNSYNDANTS